MKRKLEYVETHLVDHCNLNCQGCTHYSPLADPSFKDINDFIKEISQLAVITKQQPLKEFRLLGGEPLLHPQILDFAVISRKAFPFSNIEIVTNGILLLSQKEKFFNTLNNFNISLYLSDYNLSSEIKEILFSKVKLYRIHEKEVFIKPALNLHGSNGEENFQQCQYYFQSPCVNLRNGYLYHCPTEAYFDFFLKYFNLELKDFKIQNNGLNIFDANLEDVENYLNTNSNFCQYCDIQEKIIDRPFCLSKCQMSEWLV